jgi:hypothetical protein
MTSVYGDLGFWFMARSRMLLGVGLPLIFVPIMAAFYDGIPQSKTDQASALINAARNTGGSIGVSIISNVLSGMQQSTHGSTPRRPRRLLRISRSGMPTCGARFQSESPNRDHTIEPERRRLI